MADDPGILTIDIVSDVVCPWCYIGKRRLEKALALRPEHAVEIRWRPFQLDATIPPTGLDRLEYMTRKFGSLETVRTNQARLTGLGQAENIAFDFEAIRRSPNTLDAHRLIRWAYEEGVQDDVVTALFRAFFEEGRDIGDRAVLADVANIAGLFPDIVENRLASDLDKDTVREEIAQASALGIQGVPFFIFASRVAVSGAEAPETLARAMDVAMGQDDAA
jgi:predicted DsbA family dithiol-disulfide isomerase